jgi:preprotein translocase subunit SecF
VVQRESVTDVVLSAFAALGFAVSARFLLFISILGAIMLAVMAVNSTAVAALLVLAVYSCLTTIPLVILEIKRRP